MHVAMTMVLDPSTMPGGYSFDKIKDFIGARLHLVPPFRRRLVPVPFNLHHPVWVEDPDFDLDYHVRRIGGAVPGRASRARRGGGPDREHAARPLPAAVGALGRRGPEARPRRHRHQGPPLAPSTARRGAELMVHLFDLEPTVADPAAARARARSASRPTSSCSGYAVGLAGPAQPRARSRCSAQTVQSRRPRRPGPARPRSATSGRRPLTAPRTPWNGRPRAHGARSGFARVPLADVKAVKNHFGVHGERRGAGAVSAAPSGATCESHGGAARGAAASRCARCRSATDDDAQRRPTRCRPCSPRSPPTSTTRRARSQAIHEVTKGAKEEHNAVGADMLQNWAEFAGPEPRSTWRRACTRASDLADSHRPIHNVIISNVPGPDFPLYYAGAELVAAYPMGPVMEGAGLNVTVMSYQGLDRHRLHGRRGPGARRVGHGRRGPARAGGAAAPVRRSRAEEAGAEEAAAAKKAPTKKAARAATG